MKEVYKAFGKEEFLSYQPLATTVLGGSVAEWSARRTRNPTVPGSSPALATCWICARSSRVQILGHTCK